MKKTLMFLSLVTLVVLLSFFYYRQAVIKPLDINRIETVNQINIGAIYWSGSWSGIRNPDEQVLSFPEYQSRLPYFTIDYGNNRFGVSNNRFDIHEDSQEVIDQEIQLASTAGLDYFSFVFYLPPQSERAKIKNYGLYKYLSSSYKSQLKFNLTIVNLENFPPQNWNQSLTNHILEYLTDPQYLATSDNKLILNIFSADSLLKLSPQDIKSAIINLKTTVQKNTGKQLYLVAMSSPRFTTSLLELGFDATGSYSAADGSAGLRNAPYSTLMNKNKSTWDDYKSQGAKVIPTVNVGWDPRPRLNDPNYLDRAKNIYTWYQEATPQQLAQNVQNAIDWIRDNPSASPTKTMLIYAWNEFAEGGWLTPSRSDNNAKLNALSNVLGGTTMATPQSPFVNQTLSPHKLGTVTVTSPIEGTSLPANQPIKITGSSTYSAKLIIRLGDKTVRLVNGLGDPSSTTKTFSITLPGLTPGTYTLTINGDITPVTIPNIIVK